MDKEQYANLIVWAKEIEKNVLLLKRDADKNVWRTPILPYNHYKHNSHILQTSVDVIFENTQAVLSILNSPEFQKEFIKNSA